MPKRIKIKRQWIYIVLVFILFIMVLGLNSRIAEYFRLSSQKSEMDMRIENLRSTQVALETQIAFSRSDKAVEEWARTYERMAKPGDEIIIPLPEKEVTPDVNYITTPTPYGGAKWEIWWDLFFE